MSVDSCMNCVGQYIALSKEVFDKEFPNWDQPRHAKLKPKLDFSGDAYLLETLVGPQGGLFAEGFLREYIQVLNLRKNALMDIDCLSRRTDDDKPEFKALEKINASHNMLLSARVDLDNLLELNLSHNSLRLMPNFKQSPRLQRLIVSNNEIDDDIVHLQQNVMLRVLDLSHNRFSWKPLQFKAQLDALKTPSLEKVFFWPNPFALHFKEYQYFAAVALDTLINLDNWQIDWELRQVLAKGKTQYAIFDWTRMDAKVAEREKLGAPIKDVDGDSATPDDKVPIFSEVLAKLDEALDRPTEILKNIHGFDAMVGSVWSARFSARAPVLNFFASDDEGVGDTMPIRRMSIAEEEEHVAEFVDKMEQLIGRYESVRDVLVKCIMRLMSAGGEHFGKKCGILLAHWVDNNEYHILPNIDKVRLTFFKELCVRALPGLVCFSESPTECYETTRWSKTKDAASKDKTPEQLEAIAETETILRSLSFFAFPKGVMAEDAISPIRSALLGLLVPALCRECRDVRGEDKPSSTWAEYPGFDAFPGDGDVIEEQAENLYGIIERCVSKGYSGCVLEEADSTGISRIFFKKQAGPMLVGMRRTHPGRKLVVRPHEQINRPGLITVTKDVSWNVWCNGLAVIVAATDDPNIAASAVLDFKVHEILTVHASDSSQGFSESWIAVAADAAEAFILVLRLAQNLCKATGKAGQLAVKHFVREKLHLNCWSRTRSRLVEGGDAIPVDQLAMMPPATTKLISALVGTVCCLCTGAVDGNKEEVHQVMSDLLEVFDVFGMLLTIAECKINPDPLLFAVSLEAIYAFMSIDTVPTSVIKDVLTRTGDMVKLMPYLRGPRCGDADDFKFQDLWRLSKTKYGALDNRRNEIHAEDNNRVDWRSMVPSINEMRDPLMHRILIDIVKIIKLFNEKAKNDMTGMLINANRRMDKAGREDHLIGPAFSVVHSPNYDVKIECLRCLSAIVEANPHQLNTLETGWLLIFLSTSGIGAAKQEIFLKEVLKLITEVTMNMDEAGTTFRSCSGKAALREAFTILKENCKRGIVDPSRQQSKDDLNLWIAKFIGVCSRPVPGQLRRYLRNAFFRDILVEAINMEDLTDARSCRRELFATWTGRQMQDVLFPLVTGTSLRVVGASRYRALVRMAQVLEGRLDYQINDIFEPAMGRDESDWWPCAATLVREWNRRDKHEKADHVEQQEAFSSNDGVTQLIEVGDRIFVSDDKYLKPFSEAKAILGDCIDAGAQRVKEWLGTADDDEAGIFAGAFNVEDVGKVVPGAFTSFIEAEASAVNKYRQLMPGGMDDQQQGVTELFETRLRTVNALVMKQFASNVNVYSERLGGTSLKRFACCFADYMLENQRLFAELSNHEEDVLDHLNTEFDDHTMYNGRFQSKALVRGLPGVQHIPPIRQNLHHLAGIEGQEPKVKAFLEEAQKVQSYLKKTLVVSQKVGTSNPALEHSHNWVRLADSGTEYEREAVAGFIDFIDKYGAVVYDPKTKNIDTVLRKMAYKYKGELGRVRDAARLGIEYTTINDLVLSLKDMLRSTKIRVVRMKNRFKRPTALGRRMMILNIEIPAASRPGFHIGELRLSVRHKGDRAETRRKSLMSNIENILRDVCQVRPSGVQEVAEFIVYHCESRAIRNEDVLNFTAVNQSKCLEVVRERLEAIPPTGYESQLFRVERVAGDGVLRLGDRVRLRSQATTHYVEAYRSGQVHCNTAIEANTLGRIVFVVEAVEQEESSNNASGWVPSRLWAGGGDTSEAANPAEERKPSRAKKKIEEQEPLIVHSLDDIRLRVDDTRTYLTVMPTRGLITFGADPKVKAQKDTHLTHEFQQFKVTRRGCTEAILHMGETQNKTDHENLDTWNLDQWRRRLRCKYMVPDPFAKDLRHDDGNMRKSVTAFRAIALRQVNAPEAKPLTSRFSFQENELVRAPLMIAAMVHCIFVVLNHPCVPKNEVYLLTAIIGTLETGVSTLRSLLTLVVAAMVQGPGDRVQVSGGVDLTSAWLPAKTLRFLSTVLRKMPLGHGRLTTEEDYDKSAEDKARQEYEEKRNQKRGAYDRHNLMLLDLILSFVRKLLVPALSPRVEIAVYRPMNKHEVMLLREVARTINAVAVAFLSNPMRWCDLDAEVEDVEEALDLPTAPFGAQPHLSRKVVGVLSRKRKAEVFKDIVPGTVVRLLLHAMLYATHREALAYMRHDDADESSGHGQNNVRLLSSLANHAIHAITISMYCCSESPEADIEYVVNESISHAISHGAQVVPRSRLRHFMVERATDAFRRPIMTRFASHLEEDESILTIAFAWTTFIPDPKVSNAKVQRLKRRLYMITSGLKLFVFTATNAGEGDDANFVLPDQAHFELESIRMLEAVSKVVVAPRMLQLLGLVWVTGTDDCMTDFEFIIFESTLRKGQFLSILQIVDQKATKEGVVWRGVPRVVVSASFMHTLQESCKKESLKPIISAYVVRPPTTGTVEGSSLEVLVLTQDSVSLLAIDSFMSEFAKYCDYSEAETADVEDSDSDEDVPPRLFNSAPLQSSSKMKFSRGENAWALKDLQGVWFMAEREAKVRVHARRAEDIVFFSDCDKQRWRQQLSHAFYDRRPDQEDEDQMTNPFSVVPSGSVVLPEVKKAMQQEKVMQQAYHKSHHSSAS